MISDKMQFPEEKFIIYYTIICNNVINLLYGLPYVKPISHIALCCQIFVLYFVHSFCFFFFSFLFFFLALLCVKKNELLQLSIWESIKPKIVQRKKKIQLNIQRIVLQRGRETERKERRETNREKSMGKEETKQSDNEGVRRERKSKGKRRNERAIRVMHCVRERLFSNVFFLENNLQKTSLIFVRVFH